MSGALLASLVGKLPSPWITAISRLRWTYPALQRPYEWYADRLRHRDGRIQQGVGKGIRFNTGGANAGYLLGTSELIVQRAMAGLVHRGMTIFDIGANVGFYSVIAARLTGSSGRVVCFEPLPENAERIEYNARLNGFHWIDVRQEAVGETDGRSTFLVSAESTWGSLQVGGATVNQQVGEITVRVRSLDNLNDNGLPKPNLIKVDIEGGEGGVLLGARKMLRETRPILMIELHGTNSVIATELSSLGYRGFVLGCDCAIEEASWDAFVIAAPGDRPELVEAAKKSSQVVAP